MCLLKQSDRDTGCCHNECKNFYMLNKPMCMYSYQQSTPVVSQNTSINPAQSQIQLTSLLAQKQIPSISPTQSLNVKRPASSSVEHVIGEQETLFLNKKKVKHDDENKNEETNRNDTQPLFADLSQLSQQLLTQQQLNGDRNQQQVHYINGIPGNNGQIFVQKQDAYGYTFNQPTIYIPMVQTPQGNLSYSPMITNQQNGYTQNNQGQVMTPNIQGARVKNNGITPVYNSGNASFSSNNSSTSPSSSIPNNSSNSSNNLKSPNSATLEAFMKEFQSQTSGLLLSQNKMLLELKEKNDIIQDTLACLINEMSALKNTIKSGSQDKPNNNNTLNISPMMMSQIVSNASETATTDVLLSHLYGTSYDFQYQLVLKNNIPLPLYRERNFKFTLLLTDKDGKLVENVNKILLTIAIYSSESSPKFIDSNTAGNKILKGFIEKDLVNGSVTFDKIQIKEVTSHFRNGWIFFVVYPKVSSINNTVLVSGKDAFIPSQKIRPFILEKVVVKAKKAKEKEIEIENPAAAEIEDEGDSGDTAIFQEDEEGNDQDETVANQEKIVAE